MPRFSISVRIRHPSIDPQAITDELGWQPFRMWSAGEPRQTLKNRPLAGTYQHTYWVHEFKFENSKTFFSSCLSVVAELEKHRNFLLNVNAEGGDVRLAIYLPGDDNIGDDLAWQAMEKLVALRISLIVEVFPNFGFASD